MSGNGSARTHAVPWHRRLSLRLALLVALAMVAVDFLFGPLTDLVSRLVGLPGDAAPVYIASQIELEVEAAEAVASALSVIESPGVDGAWVPDPRSVEIASMLLEVQEEGFVLIDGSGAILATGGVAPWSVGESWSFPMRSHTELELPDAPMPYAHAIYVPVGPDGAGLTLANLIFTEVSSEEMGEAFCGAQAGLQDADDGARTVADWDEYEQLFERQYLLARAISLGVIVPVAVLLAFLLTRWVTRRLSRLSAAAAAPVAEDGGLPGPFDDRGGDEIAVLAGTMNSMRARIAELVDGLAARDAARREWVAQVSHDLRTPLTALMACIDRAERMAGELQGNGSRSELLELLDVARTDADRVQVLADDLLEIARLDAGDELALEPVPPGELVRQAAKALGPAAAQKGIALDVSLATGLPILSADGRRLMRAVENLLRNAIDHGRERVVVSAEVAGDRVRFEVRDDGPGFPGESGEVALDRPRGERRRSDSAGLGLVVTRRVAEAHRGEVGARNLPSGGAAVWFEIPGEPGG